ncbi:hypothetical protein HG537_0C01190 [Torulaspora globosa]|uniref:PPIase cyclophilin-type domain-containing protein n=1 Tax=Torulaspora globosa TaxID=48254 RepID=A0A7H9HSY7_9SACH|nr:hypothetical protein HG537_0C01190 [Torulaspora sp. CBS 2947]
MLEPLTSAKVIIYTAKGRLDLELWAREKPGHARRFLESCSRGLLVGGSLDEMSRSGDCIMFSKVVGDGRPVLAERNGRIRWRRGSLGWDSVLERWFISLGDGNEDGEREVIGKVVDESIYTLRRIVDESEIGSDGKFLYPATVCKVEVTIPYFDDLPGKDRVEPARDSMSVKKRAKVRISFDDDDDDDDGAPMKKLKIKMPATIQSAQEGSNPAQEVSGGDQSADRTPQEGSDEADIAQESEPERSETTAAGQKGDKSTVSSREQETLKMLALFEEKTKDKNILNR